MIAILNERFFTFECENSKLKDSTNALIKIKAEPKSIDLQSYKKVAFADIIVPQSRDYMPLNSDKSYMNYEDDAIIEGIKFMSPRINSTYENSLAVSYMKEFTSNDKFPSMIIDKDPEKNDRIFLLVAIPVIGVLAPTKKSVNYKLYNGSFVINTSKFSYMCDDCEYTKIAYFFIDFITSFSVLEYIPITGNFDHGIVREHVVMTRFDENNNLECILSRNDSVIPRKGREDFFIPKLKGNLFALSDMPENVTNDKRGTVSIKL